MIFDWGFIYVVRPSLENTNLRNFELENFLSR